MTKNKIVNTTAMFLMLTISVTLVALPNANAQSALIMNLPGAEGVPHLVLIGTKNYDIDLNGGPGPGYNVSLFAKYPGRSVFTYIWSGITSSSGDLDYYNFNFNETGDFQLKWALPPSFTVESNVEIARVVTELPTSTKKTYAYIGATPNPVGVGQEVLLHFGITDELQNVAHGREGFTVTVEKPGGTTETLGPFRSDSTGGTGTIYIPDTVGNYTLQTHFPAQWYNWTGGDLEARMWYEASDSRILTLVVQEEPLKFWPGVPLPTEYWTRPVDAQNREWYTISGHWLETGDRNLLAPYNDDAPESAHILWAKPLAQGGLGGLMGLDNRVHGYEIGDAYEGKFDSSVIINGVLYYNRYESRGGTYVDRDIVAVDLHTGEELWCKPLIGRTGTTTGATVSGTNRLVDGVSDQFPDGIGRALAFGQVFYWDSYNYHGVYGLLWTVSGSTWFAFDALTGRWIYTITNVPSGETVRGPSGELYRLQVNNAAGWMALWNSSALVSMAGSWNPHGNVYNASGRTSSGAMPSQVARAWVYNKTIPTLPGSTGGVGVLGTGLLGFLSDRIIGSTADSYGARSQSQGKSMVPIVNWAISLKPGQEGQVLFNRTWQQPPGNLTVSFGATSEDGVFTLWSKETRQHYGFSADTGEYLWTTEPQDYLDVFGNRITIYDGKLISVGYSGAVFAYDVKTGERLWTHYVADPLVEILWSNNWPVRPLFFTDGKVYLGHEEHSPVDPRPRGAPFLALDIETGEAVFRIDGAFRQTSWGGRAVIGDSIIATMDTYDNRIYAIGKGPSATVISASPEVTVYGNRILLKGMVTDISPGTMDSGLAMRFPDGVPAVSDDSMSEWMLYVYKQFPRPTNASGVEVTLSVLDANNNYREIGKTTSNSDGFFAFTWKPDIEGQYTVFASFGGSGSYWPSHAVTAFTVDSAPEAPQPVPAMQSTSVDQFFLPAVSGLAVLMIVICVLLAMLLLKKKQ